METIKKVVDYCREIMGISISDKQIEQLSTYEKLLVVTNEVMNLTSIVDHDGVWYKHFLDSITILDQLPEQNTKLIDVGTGGGFPGMVIAIIRPDINVTLLDATKKKVEFLKMVAEKLCLNNVRFIHGRSEEVAHNPQYRESFDYATTRAVSSFNTCLEICIGLIKKDGHLLLMRGPSGHDEYGKSTGKLTLFSLILDNYKLYENPYSLMNSYVFSFSKTKVTNKNYPRSYARIVSDK